MGYKLRVQYWPIDKVKPYPNNPRNNDDAVEYVANSIREFGWQQPIVVDTDSTIIAGHTRLKAAKRLGMDAVPVVVADNLTPAQVSKQNFPSFGVLCYNKPNERRKNAKSFSHMRKLRKRV